MDEKEFKKALSVTVAPNKEELQKPWGLSVSQEYTNMISGIWWTTLFPALAIASTVIAVNLIADSLQSVANE